MEGPGRNKRLNDSQRGTVKKRLTTNLKDVVAQLEKLDKLRSNWALSCLEELHVVRVFFYALDEVLATAPEDALVDPNMEAKAFKRVSYLLGYDLSQVRSIIQRWLDENKVGKEAPEGLATKSELADSGETTGADPPAEARPSTSDKAMESDAPKTQSLSISKRTIASALASVPQRSGKLLEQFPNTLEMFVKVRDFVHEKSAHSVNSTRILDMLAAENLVQFRTDSSGFLMDKLDYASHLNEVASYLERTGFHIDARSSKVSIPLEQQSRRDRYVRLLGANRLELGAHKRYREVYLDETIVKNSDGNRCYVVAAIQEGSPMLSNGQSTFLSLSPFSSSVSRKHNLTWWKSVFLPCLSEPCMIVMSKTGTGLRECGSKEDVMKRLDELGVPYEREMSRAEVVQILREYIKETGKTEITRLVEAEGHTVLFSAPFYPDLHPVKLLWGKISHALGQKKLPYSYELVVEELERISSGNSEVTSAEELVKTLEKPVFEFQNALTLE